MMKAQFQRKRPQPPPPTGANDGLFQRKRPQPASTPQQPQPPPPPPPPQPLPQAVLPSPITSVAQTPLPDDLRLLGNRKAWEQLDFDKPVLIHGPVGCGKTQGVRSYLKHQGLRCVEVDVCDFPNSSDLERLLRSTISKSCEGPWALLLDDVEGILQHEGYAKVLATWLRDEPSMEYKHAPVILTCNDMYATSLRLIKALVDKGVLNQLRMFAPNGNTCKEYFNARYPQEWTTHAIKYRDNDLRQIQHFLDAASERKAFREASGGRFDFRSELPTLSSACADRSRKFFDSLTGLIKRSITCDEWVRETGTLTERVAFSNYPTLASDDLEACSAMADAVSTLDVAHPICFEQRKHAVPFGDQIIAHSLQVHAKGSGANHTLKAYPHLKRGSASYEMPSALGGLTLSKHA